MYLSNMEPAMRPADAFAKMAHREIERVLINDLENRITAVLLTPYPPGIPLLIPANVSIAPSSATCNSPAISIALFRGSRPMCMAWSRVRMGGITWIAWRDDTSSKLAFRCMLIGIRP
jgi:hypothetical protein